MSGETQRDGTRRRRAPRRWCVPAAMQHDPADKIEGNAILGENAGELGLLLWQAVRDVTLWGMTPPELRGELFADGTAHSRMARLAGTALPPKPSAVAATLVGMLAAPSPAREDTVAICCLEVAAWARRAGRPHTAVAFARAGAVAAPEFAEAALHVGIHARATGQDTRAETWLRRAVTLARRERDRAAYSSALVELGALHESRADPLRAERYYRMAFAAGRRFGARVARMRAAHGLFRLARQRGDDASAAQFALVARNLHEPDAAGAADVALDLARFWMDVDEPERAQAAMRRLVPLLPMLSQGGQLAAFALTARARSQWGHLRKGSAAARAAWALLEDETIEAGVRYAAAMDLAHAARRAGDLPAFNRAKRLVLRLAPQAEFPDVAARIATLWPEGEAPRMDKAS